VASYVPLGGVVISDDIAATFSKRVFPGGLTYSGHPLACASAVASIKIFKEEGIEHARSLEDDTIGPGLEKLALQHPPVGEMRALGVFWAIELVRNRVSRKPLVPFNATGPETLPMQEFATSCKESVLWPFVHFNRTHIVPPRHRWRTFKSGWTFSTTYLTSRIGTTRVKRARTFVWLTK
jgi:taurine--2-oxoglutarate transaminase